MSAGKFLYSHRVTYADCTVGNHIYYSRYFDLLEAARGEMFRHLGVTFLQWQTQDSVFPVIECRVRYKAPARYDDVLGIELWATAAERIRLNFAYQIRNQAEDLILEAGTQHVCTSVQGEPKRLPEELVKSLQPYLTASVSK
ncbi:MAG TPA: thioesterase family protein [Verrucomicrobiae bacterium]|jgi:acyl-CoA thioester hydrolase|nr:thioesterase family protein [Verrucomicrobiae bacterium]